MKIPNKRAFQQVIINHSLYNHLKGFINLYKKCTAEPYSLVVKDTTIESDSPIRFRCNYYYI